MAAVTVKEESEDPDYYQYNIQGNTVCTVFLSKSYWQLKFKCIDCLTSLNTILLIVSWLSCMLIIYHWNKIDFKKHGDEISKLSKGEM